MDYKRFFKWFILIVAIALVITSCPSGKETQQEKAAPDKPVIKLAENPWISVSLNNAVAKILLEEKMGYPVEVVAISDTAQFPALAKGDIHASLELWPSGHANNLKIYIEDKGTVENGGPLGPVGKLGWFMPAYILTDHPELATWEGFKDPENAALFRTLESGDKGQFLAGDPTWTQYDADIIRNLGLGLQVVEVGSEEALIHALDVAYSKKKPILFYFWTPHSAFAKYALTEVKLPAHDEACYAKADMGGVNCDYPPDVLTKIFWQGLKGHAPKAYNFLKEFRYTNEDQITMMAMVDYQGKTVEEAARFWVEQNENVWRGWIH